MTDEIRNDADTIDSRDVIERIAALEADADSGELDDEGRAELASLRKFAEQGENFADWIYGETFIRESYFETYAKELAESIGAVPSDGSWPLPHIDWEAAAEALLVDYTDIDFDGVTYYAR
jgi:hypothetical protein